MLCACNKLQHLKIICTFIQRRSHDWEWCNSTQKLVEGQRIVWNPNYAITPTINRQLCERSSLAVILTVTRRAQGPPASVCQMATRGCELQSGESVVLTGEKSVNKRATDTCSTVPDSMCARQRWASDSGRYKWYCEVLIAFVGVTRNIVNYGALCYYICKVTTAVREIAVSISRSWFL